MKIKNYTVWCVGMSALLSKSSKSLLNLLIHKISLSRESFAYECKILSEERTSQPISLKASITVEAAFVLPLFLYLMLSFLYFLQIFTVQELIQSGITRMGLNLSKSAYVYEEFPSADDILNIDISIFGEEYDFGWKESLVDTASQYVLKQYARDIWI